VLNNLSKMSAIPLVRVKYTIVGKQEYKDKATDLQFVTNIDGLVDGVMT